MIDVRHGDCLDVMARLDPVDAIVCDPPYHLTTITRRFRNRDGSRPSGFMGKTWDGGDIAFQPEVWAAALALLPPGGYLVAFGGTRTHHRLWCAIEDAGFEIRDTVAWMFGSGFPKSRALLKPAFEPICLARKPGPLRHLAIDACRVEAPDGVPQFDRPAEDKRTIYGAGLGTSTRNGEVSLGRWPANVVHDGSAEVLEAFARFGERCTHGGGSRGAGGQNGVYGNIGAQPEVKPGFPDIGTAARFFFSGKAGPDDRCGSAHPTVKPVSLMRWLCRLVTPPGGTVLDPFAGSGTTGVACVREGFNAVLIEREREYYDDIRRRLDRLAGLDTPLFSQPETCGLSHCPEVCLDGYCASKDGALSYEAACKALAEAAE